MRVHTHTLVHITLQSGKERTFGTTKSTKLNCLRNTGTAIYLKVLFYFIKVKPGRIKQCII